MNSMKTFISKLILIYTLDLKAKKSLVSEIEWKLNAAKSQVEDAELKLKKAQDAQLDKGLTEDDFANL